jgi:protein O-mannosyl-transferase
MSGKKNKPAANSTTPPPMPIVTESGSGLFQEKYSSVWLLLTLVLTAAAFFPALSNGFLAFDDPETITKNQAILSLDFGALLTQSIVGMYVPVSALIYGATFAFFGAKASAFHAVSVLLHLGVTALLWQLLRALRFNVSLTFAVTLLFSLHATKVEPIAWVAAQTTLTFSLFYVLGLWCWVKYRDTDQPKWQWITLLVFVVAALSKSAAITFPLLLPVLDWYLGRNRSFRLGQYAYLLPFLALSVALGIYTITTRERSGAEVAVSSSDFNVFDRLLMISHTILFYFGKLLVPINLSSVYPIVKTGGSWRFDFYIAPLIMAGIAYWLWRCIKADQKVPVLSAALFILPISIMLPLASVGSFELRNDRYLYLPSVGFFLLLMYLLQQRLPKIMPIVGAVAALVYGAMAFQHIPVWKNDKTLFSQCVEHYPDAQLCQCNLAYGALLLKDYETAIQRYTTAIEQDVNCVECYNGRGNAYLMTNKIKEAFSDFDKALASGAETPLLYLNRGKCHAMLGRPAQAIPDLQKSIAMLPDNPETWYFLGSSFDKSGNAAKALESYDKALQLNPNYVEALVNRGILQYQQQRYEASIADQSAALKICIQQVKPMILTNRANAYLALRQPDKALADADAALAIDGRFARAQQSRTAALQMLGR